FGKEDEPVAACNARMNLVAGMRGARAALALDENRFLKPRQRAEERPARNLALGDEGTGLKRGHDRNVEPGCVVRHDETGATRIRFATNDDANADKTAKKTVIEIGQAL